MVLLPLLMRCGLRSCRVLRASRAKDARAAGIREGHSNARIPRVTLGTDQSVPVVERNGRAIYLTVPADGFVIYSKVGA